jgi:4-amino-4-deoxy-L-arabinose transferase-like glycosyltransferase
VITHPAVLVALVCWLVLLVFRVAPALESLVVHRRALVTASIVVLCAFAAIVGWYALRLVYFDPAEPTITAVASVFASGQPLYPALDDPERYAHIYGPVLFIVQAGALAVAGSSIFTSKAVGPLAILSSLILMYRLFRRHGPPAALVSTAACALVYLGFGNVTFWTRSDPLLILCVVLGLAATELRGRLASAIGLGVTLGVAANLKLTAPLYLLPAIMMTADTHDRRTAAAALGVAGMVAAAPFLLPTISLSHYLSYVRLSARNGLEGAKVRQNLEWIVFLCVPLAVRLSAGGWRTSSKTDARFRHLVAVLVASMIVTAIAASKPGGGPFHLLPFVPVIAYLTMIAPADDRSWRRAAMLACGIAAVSIAIPRQRTFLSTVAKRDLRPAVADLRQFMHSHPGRSVAVGYASTSYLSYARPEVVFHTHDYLLDAPAIQEHRLSGLPMPKSTLRAIEECRIHYWLIPAGGDPFVVPSAYFPKGPQGVFPNDFRAAFLSRYSRTSRIALFDVWECRPGR